MYFHHCIEKNQYHQHQLHLFTAPSKKLSSALKPTSALCVVLADKLSLSKPSTMSACPLVTTFTFTSSEVALTLRDTMSVFCFSFKLSFVWFVS